MRSAPTWALNSTSRTAAKKTGACEAPLNDKGMRMEQVDLPALKALAQAKPAAWARKWHMDGVTPAKERNENGRLVWPLKFKFHPVTPIKVQADDVGLYAIDPAAILSLFARVEQQEARIEDVEGQLKAALEAEQVLYEASRCRAQGGNTSVDLSGLTRYEPANGGDDEDAFMFPIPSGVYVKLSDVQSLLSPAPAVPVGGATDERIDQLWGEAKGDSAREITRAFARAIEREVLASQAWNGELPELPDPARYDPVMAGGTGTGSAYTPHQMQEYARKAIGAAVAGVRDKAFLNAALAFAQAHIDANEMEARDEQGEGAVSDDEYDAKHAAYNRTKAELLTAYRALKTQPAAAKQSIGLDGKFGQLLSDYRSAHGDRNRKDTRKRLVAYIEQFFGAQPAAATERFFPNDGREPDWAAYATAEAGMVDIKELVNRFLSWPLPASLTASMHPGIERPIGTLLMNADEAKAMFEYCLLPPAATEQVKVPDELISVVGMAVRSVLHSHNLTTYTDSDGAQLPLVDHLSRPGEVTIKTGQDEIELIADTICDEFEKIGKAFIPAPVARLQAMEKEGLWHKDQLFFDVVILDKSRCFDGMPLYAAPAVASAEQVRNAALEEAAKECDHRSRNWLSFKSEPDMLERGEAAKILAETIRGMRTPSTNGAPSTEQGGA